MLVITRRIKERLMINGEEVILSVLGIDRGQVKIGISAPKHITIQRAECINQKQKCNTKESQKNNKLEKFKAVA